MPVITGAVLVNVVGPPLGKIGLVNNEVNEATINQNIVALQDPVNCLPEYVWYCLRSPTYNTRLVNLGVGIRQSFINTTKIREFKIPIPSLDVQTRIVSFLNEVQTLVSNMLVKQKKMLTEIDAMGYSILESAFEGNLQI